LGLEFEIRIRLAMLIWIAWDKKWEREREEEAIFVKSRETPLFLPHSDATPLTSLSHWPVFSSSFTPPHTRLQHHKSHPTFSSQLQIHPFDLSHKYQAFGVKSGRKTEQTTMFLVGLGGDVRHRTHAGVHPCNLVFSHLSPLTNWGWVRGPNNNRNFESVSQFQSIMGPVCCGFRHVVLVMRSVSEGWRLGFSSTQGYSAEMRFDKMLCYVYPGDNVSCEWWSHLRWV